MGTVQEFKNIVFDDSNVVHDCYPISDDKCVIIYSPTAETQKVGGSSNVVIAAYTTAHARIKMYRTLELLGNSLCYMDTDSVLFIKRPGGYTPPIGVYMGDFGSELDSGKYICRWVCGGPKNYSYKTVKAEKNGLNIKNVVKGFTLDFATSEIINFDSIERLVVDYKQGVRNMETITIDTIGHFHRDKKLNKIFTLKEKKRYQIHFDKRVMQNDFTSLPFGY